MRCSECENDIDRCAYCDKKFEIGEDIVCFDTGVTYLHYCDEDCLIEDILEHRIFAVAREGIEEQKKGGKKR